ncbi:NRDE family protein [Balneolales bacterium ANBcel1]|nr:NRDE family protein [Balneolales bacterium ANBcel1]
MCTITYLPTGPGSFLLASNRDEQKTREGALPPKKNGSGKVRALWPVDGKAGGTWIGLAETGCAFALMNDYQSNREASAPVSRGIIIPEVIDCRSAMEVTQRLEKLHERSFSPYRLVMATPNGVHLWHFDGKELRDAAQGRGAGLWVSAGKEEERVRQARSRVFEAYLKGGYSDDLKRIQNLHTHRDQGPGAFAFEISRGGIAIQTVSATVAEFREDGPIRMHYMAGLPDRQKKWQTHTLESI